MRQALHRVAHRYAAALVAIGVVAAAGGLGVAEAAPRFSRAKVVATAEIVVTVGIDGIMPVFFLDGLRVGRAGGTIVMSPNGTSAVSGDVVLGAVPQPPPAIKLSAPQRGAMMISMSRHVLLSGPAGVVVVDSFTSDAPAHGVLWTGSRDIHVGARIALPGGLPPGVYTGSYELTLENN